MKRLPLCVAFAALFVVVLAGFAQIASSPAARTNSLPDLAGFPTNRLFSGPAFTPRRVWRDGDETAILPPGVYLTKPYTCMVKVPGATHDEMCQNPPPAPNLPMQILQPDLNSVPLGRSGN
jgi:hypothetical protein